MDNEMPKRSKLTEAQIKRAAKYREDGLPDTQIAKQLGVSGYCIACHLGLRGRTLGVDAKARIMAKRYGIPIEEAVAHYENNEWYCKTCKSWKSEPKVTMRKCERCRNG